MVDNNATAGPAFKALLPDGLDAELRPLGASQVVAAESLRERQDLETKLSQARAAEMGARERFVKAHDSNMGAIRQIFPRDLGQQDMYFDQAPSRRAAVEDKGEVTGEDKGEETSAPPTPDKDTKPK